MSLLLRRRMLMAKSGTSLLPSAYQQVDYIENTGTQCINVGLKPTSNTGVDIVYQSLNYGANASQYILGAREGTTGVIQYALNGSGTRDDWDVRLGGTPTYSEGLTRTADKYRSVVKSNGGIFSWELTNLNTQTTKKYNIGSRTVTATTNLYLFAYNPSQIHSNLRVYSCKIYENDTIVRYFIPCYRKSDRTAGLYDLINEVFYENEGIDNFRYNALPKEYQQVEYVESDGTQYIDSEFTPNQDTKIYAKFKLTKIGANYPFGARETSSTNVCYISGGASTWNFRFGKTANVVHGTTDTNLNVIEMSLGAIRWNGYNLNFNMNKEDFTCPGNLYIFALNNNGATAYGRTHIYHLMLYDNGVLIRDFVPCYRKSDNEIGLYDTVENKFYANQGAGTFLKGADI